MSLRSRLKAAEDTIETLKNHIDSANTATQSLESSFKALQADIEKSQKINIESQLKHHDFSTGKVVTLSRHYSWIGYINQDVVLLNELVYGWYVVDAKSLEGAPFFAYNTELFEKKEDAK